MREGEGGRVGESGREWERERDMKGGEIWKEDQRMFIDYVYFVIVRRSSFQLLPFTSETLSIY